MLSSFNTQHMPTILKLLGQGLNGKEDQNYPYDTLMMTETYAAAAFGILRRTLVTSPLSSLEYQRRCMES